MLTLLPLLLGVAGLVMAGCPSTGHKGGKIVPWNLKITKRPAASVEVDLLGVNRSDDTYWRDTLKPDDYWNPNKTIRKQVKDRTKSTKFESGSEFVLSRDDDMWQKWFQYGSMELLVIADLPGKFSNDASDPRRKFLPLGKNEWEPATKRTIELEILDDQIRVLTPQAP